MEVDVRKIKAIETKYKGYRFRSRLEARWAVFFDALGITYEYEPEGFQLPNGEWYLPDFRVTTKDGDIVFYEVKPKHVNTDRKFLAFSKLLNSKAICISDPQARMLSGDPINNLFDGKKDYGVCPRCGIIGSFDFGLGFIDDCVLFGCGFCDYHTPVGIGNKSEQGLVAEVEPYKGWQMLVGSYDKYIEKIYIAAKKARQARFEHGETP